LKRLLIISIVLILLALVSGSCSTRSTPAPNQAAPAPTAAAKVLHLANFDTHDSFTAPAIRSFASELEKRTKGRYKVDIAWAGAMGKMTDHYNLIRTGVADIGYFLPRFSPGVFPLLDFSDLPWVLPDYNLAVKSMWQVYKRGLLDRQFSEIRPIFMWTGTGTNLFSRQPINSLSEMKGKKVQSGSESVDSLLKPMGAVPVSVALPETFEAMQKGVIDAVWGPWISVAPLKWHEVAHYCIGPVFGNALCIIAFNKDTWNGLPRDVQEIIDQLPDDMFIPQIIAGYQDVEGTGKKNFTSVQGKESNWSAEDLNQMSTMFANVWTHWISSTEAKGVPAKATCEALWSTLKINGVNMPAVGYTPSK
jgi:TRAP-type transport system periplasmic protein